MLASYSEIKYGWSLFKTGLCSEVVIHYEEVSVDRL